MSRTVNIEDSLTIYPSGYDANNSSYYGVSSSYPISNGYDGSDSTNYAYIQCNTGSRAETHFSYTFDVSGVPEGATIDSVTCTAKTRVSSTNYLTASTIQLYKGSTAKGSSVSADSTTASARTITNTGSWTYEEIQDLQIRVTATRGTSNTSRAAYIYFYGATLTINYSIHGTAYTIAATSHVSNVTVDPASQEVMEGGSATVSIYADMIDDLTITDNGTDIVNELVVHEVETGGTKETVLGNYELVSGSFNGSGASYFSSIVGNGANASQTTTSYYSGGNGTIAVFTYDLVFEDIPSNATITQLYCEVNGHAESTSNANEYMCAQLISGNTDISEEYNFKSAGTTSNTTHTLTATTLPTLAQLENLKLQCRLGYYGGAINGATCYVTYTVPSSGSDYYWTYTIENVAADHVILIEQTGPFIPPEEDPTYNYYPVTISSINATTEPFTGTERIQEGTNQVITINPTDPQLTLALDNGVDITNQLVGSAPTNTYTIDTKVSGASYGFNLNNSTGYYVSTNNGVSKSASVARINMNFESSCLVTIQYINYAEADYDYGMFGKLDTAVATDGLSAASGGSTPSDSTSNYLIPKCSNSSSAQTVTYEVPSGEHFIDVKYGKDDASDSGNDSLQWKITSVEATGGGGSYTYTLTNISQSHSLIFVFGNVDYYFITSSGNNCKMYPDGQVVKLDGDGYLLRIVPNDATATVTLRDNNVDRTSLLNYESTTDRYGNTIVNYTYELDNISAAHTIVVTCSSTTGVKIFVKINNSWIQGSKVWVKTNGTWVEQNSSTWTTIFDTRTNYRLKE